MSALKTIEYALTLIEEAEGLELQAQLLLQPLHEARGSKGMSDPLTAVCGQPQAAVVRTRQRQRRMDLVNLARSLDADAQ